MTDTRNDTQAPAPGSWILVAIAWAVVGMPLAWGIWKTLEKARILFQVGGG